MVIMVSKNMYLVFVGIIGTITNHNLSFTNLVLTALHQILHFRPGARKRVYEFHMMINDIPKRFRAGVKFVVGSRSI